MSALTLALGRLWAWLWRFRTLALADRLFAGVAAPRVLERKLFGLRLRADVGRGNQQRLLYLEGERFVGERAMVRRLLRPGMRAVDVGANIGYYLLLLESVVGAAGRVACFEPEPENLRELERNIRVNEFANVDLFAAAVGAQPGTVSLRAGINGAIVADGAGGAVTVPMVTLDSAIPGPVDFVKIDVEGWEGHVLAGAKRLLLEHRPALWVEIHPGFLAPPYTVDGILAEIRRIHGGLQLLEIAPQDGFAEKARARYLGRPVRSVPNPEILLAECRAMRRQEPFWAVASGRVPA